MRDSIEVPWQVRWVRFFWLREAQLSQGDQKARATALRYAREVRRRWVNAREVPVVGVDQGRAMDVMSRGVRAGAVAVKALGEA